MSVQREPVAVVGLGAMGAAMAARLAASGLVVKGWDRDPEKRAACPQAVETLQRTTSAFGVALLSLPASPAVEEVTGALLPLLSPGALIVDASTADPASTRALQARAAAVGVGYVDAPVSGGPAGAAAGRLLVMMGGEDADVARAEAAMAPLARAVVRCGGPGAGNVVKLVNNLLCSAHLLLAGEALRIGEAAGLDPQVLAAALAQGSGRSGAVEANLPQWVLSGTYDSGFSLGLMAKDVALAERLGALGPLSQAAAALVADALAARGPGADFNRLVDEGRGPG